ncbi:MAG: hypothetical protein M9941_11595 [Anaerolineae bacterium]|nr:hypothetical protein [Anaerolineae bacterium]
MLRKMIGIGAILAILVAGIWAVSTYSGPAAETTARNQAIGMMATGGTLSNSPIEEPPAQGIVEPVAVTLADIPAGVYDPNNQFDRWQRGEIDMENESLRTEAEIAALQDAAMNAGVSENVQVAALDGRAPVAGTSFDSLDINDCCGGGANVPPDPEMAAGPNHVIAVVNVAVEVYDKSGTSLTGPVTLASFLGVNPTCTGVFDPNVLYDEKEDRWIIAADANGTHYCAAASQTSDPLGAYNVYAFPTGGGLFFDYPHAGVGEDAIYMGANMFSGSFVDSRVWALDKAAMYSGAAAAFLMQNLGSTQDTPQPMNLHGWAQGTWPTDLKHYIITETGFNGANHTLYEWDGPFSGPNTFGSTASINLNTATGTTALFPVNVTQSGGGGTITANDWRPLDFEYRNGYGWTTMTIGCNPGGGTVNCVRWAQIELPTGAIGPEGAGVFSSTGTHRWFPDLAVNDCDDMAVGYSKSSSSMFPAVWVTGREDADPAGTLQSEVEMKAGEITYTAFDGAPRRWGDYTGMTIDPDGQTFWYLGEYSKITGNANGRWGTYIGSFTYPDCGGGGTDTVISRKIKSIYNHPNFPGLYLAKVQAVDPVAMLPVAGAVVDVTLTLPDGTTMPSAVANSSGWAKYQQATAGGGNCTITVDNITAPGYTFDPFQGVTTQTISCSILESQLEWTETP